MVYNIILIMRRIHKKTAIEGLVCFESFEILDLGSYCFEKITYLEVLMDDLHMI